MKVAPIVGAMKSAVREPSCARRSTGPYIGRAMFGSSLRDLGQRPWNVHLGVGSGLRTRRANLPGLLERRSSTFVLQEGNLTGCSSSGDVNSSIACAWCV
jgi:hypothetical protein